LRLGVGEKLVDGRIHMILACGHTVEPNLDEDGLWKAEARNCPHCLRELQDGARQSELLPDVVIMQAMREGDWALSGAEEREWLARAKQVWYFVRYGDKGVRFEQST
jgi:hypothetical protein